MAYQVSCPCGETMYGIDEDAVVRSAQDHLSAVHDRSYTASEILFMASEIPDRLMPQPGT